MRLRSRESALRVVLVATLVACVSAPVVPVADDDTRAAPESTARNWYGWEIVAADATSGLAVAVAAGILRVDIGEAILIGGIGYLVGGPIVHLANGEGGGAARSLGLRLLLPVAVGALGAGIGALAAGDGRSVLCSSERACGALFGGIIGVGIAIPIAMAIDWGNASTSLPPSSPASTGSHEASLTPLVVVTPDIKAMMLVGRF